MSSFRFDRRLNRQSKLTLTGLPVVGSHHRSSPVRPDDCSPATASRLENGLPLAARARASAPYSAPSDCRTARLA